MVTKEYILLSVLVFQLCPTLCNPMDCSLPGSSCPGNSPGQTYCWLLWNHNNFIRYLTKKYFLSSQFKNVFLFSLFIYCILFISLMGNFKHCMCACVCVGVNEWGLCVYLYPNYLNLHTVFNKYEFFVYFFPLTFILTLLWILQMKFLKIVKYLWHPFIPKRL